MSASGVSKGMPIQTLSALAAQGQALLGDFDKFNYRADERFISFRTEIISRVAAINESIEMHQKNIADLWQDIHDITSVDDARRIRAKIQAMLSAGLSDQERTDLESADRSIGHFLTEVEKLSVDTNADALESLYHELVSIFTDDLVDLTQVLHNTYIKRHNEIIVQEKDWCERWLAIVPENMSQNELDAWKASTVVVPVYVSDEKRRIMENVRASVERALTKCRIDYIVTLFQRLSEEEKEICIEELSRYRRIN